MNIIDDTIIKELKKIKDYFGENDASMFNQMAFMTLHEHIKALDNLTSSSRIIHSQPTRGFHYWIKRKDHAQWEVAFVVRIGEVNYLCPNNEQIHLLPSSLGDWCSEPISYPKG